MNVRVRIGASLSPGFAKQIKERSDTECDGNISEYIKRALHFYEDFGTNDECVKKINIAAIKEKRTPRSFVTAIIEDYFDRVTYFKTFK